MYTMQAVRNPPAAKAMPHRMKAFQIPHGKASDRFVTAPSPSTYRDASAYPPSPHNVIKNPQPKKLENLLGNAFPASNQQATPARQIPTSTANSRNKISVYVRSLMRNPPAPPA